MKNILRSSLTFLNETNYIFFQTSFLSGAKKYGLNTTPSSRKRFRLEFQNQIFCFPAKSIQPKKTFSFRKLNSVSNSCFSFSLSVKIKLARGKKWRWFPFYFINLSMRPQYTRASSYALTSSYFLRYFERFFACSSS